MPYTVYKVTNNLTQDFYIGVHKTNNLMDDYLGSGKAIREQVALHGPENFTKEILHIFELKREAYQKEAEMVDPLLGTPGCLNLHPGGHGGFGYINAKGLNNLGDSRGTPEHRSALARAGMLGSQTVSLRLRTDPEFRQAWVERSRKALRERTIAPFTGHSHSPQTKRAMSIVRKRQGTKRVGWRWFYNAETLEPHLVPPGALHDYTAPTWLPGKKPPTPRRPSIYAPLPKDPPPICPECLTPFRTVGRGNRAGQGGECSCTRNECVRRYEAGESPKHIMATLHISSSTLYHWTNEVRQRRKNASIAQLA